MNLFKRKYPNSFLKLLWINTIRYGQKIEKLQIDEHSIGRKKKKKLTLFSKLWINALKTLVNKAWTQNLRTCVHNKWRMFGKHPQQGQEAIILLLVWFILILRNLKYLTLYLIFFFYYLWLRNLGRYSTYRCPIPSIPNIQILCSHLWCGLQTACHYSPS